MIKIIAKFVFAIAIIVWLLKKGELDFALIPQSLNHIGSWLICILILIFNEILTSYRWKYLLEIKTQEKLPLWAIVKLTWIGMFFSSVLPGAVTGDLIKMLYARHLNPKLTKSFLFTSVFLDRLIGLIGLLIIMGIFSTLFYREIIEYSADIRYIIHLNFLLFAGAILFLCSLFLPMLLQNRILNLFHKIPLVGHRIAKLLEQAWLIGKNKKTIFQCLILAVTSQLIYISGFWILVSPFLNIAVPLKFAFTFVPLGFIAIAIPIAPSGLGVGHAIFGTLFAYFGVKGGASLFNLYFIALVGVNLLGVIPYLTSNRQYLKEN